MRHRTGERGFEKRARGRTLLAVAALLVAQAKDQAEHDAERMAE